MKILHVDENLKEGTMHNESGNAALQGLCAIVGGRLSRTERRRGMYIDDGWGRYGRVERDNLQQLAAGVAHNLNNQLTSVICGAEFALDRVRDDHPARAWMQLVSRSSDQAAGLVRQLMAYAGISPFIPSPQDLSRLTHRAIASARGSIPRHVELRLDLAAAPPLIQADPKLIGQLIQVLLANAVQAICDGKGVIWVRTHVGKSGDPLPEEGRCAEWSAPKGWMCLEVRDNGCGMAESVIQRIFDPFFSTKSMGRGLGLAAAAGIVQRHGAVIRVESAPCSGSTFQVYFPACAPDQPTEEARAA